MLNKIQSMSIETFQYKKGYEFEGIINYLTVKTGGNIHDNNTIEVTSNSIGDFGLPRDILDLNNKFYDAESDEKNFWVCFDFKNMEIEITHYSIKTFNYDCAHIKNWVIEISNDKEDWQQIDERLNCDDLNHALAFKTFKVNKNHFARYCRFRHKGKFWEYSSGRHSGINCIEFFGILKTSC